MLRTKTIVSMWGNSQVLRLPIEMSRQLGIHANDEVVLELNENVMTISKPTTPRKGTIEYLFKDYSGESFKTEITNPLETDRGRKMVNNVPMQGDIIKINLDPKQGHEQKGYRP